MTTFQRTMKNHYRDSVALMQLSSQLRALDGVRQASAVMATANNLSLLVEAGLLNEMPKPSPNDLLVVVETRDEASATTALDKAQAMLDKPVSTAKAGETREAEPRSLQMGQRALPGANLALISTPGEYAAAEARKALQLGMHVMIFSDNVPIKDEIALKQYSREHDLLVMGPDCGTAIINGIPLGFADVVRRGDIGVVAAAGTGLQQVTCLIDRFGGGISQAIGTGSHDLSADVGGITMQQGIESLAADPKTKVIVLISKPPAPSVTERVLATAGRSGKPVVVDFIGAKARNFESKLIAGVGTLEDAAAAAVSIAKGKKASPASGRLPAKYARLVAPSAQQLKRQQKYVRGLFSGGTFCYETVLLLSEKVGTVFSNTPLRPEGRLGDVWKSIGHSAIDFGDDLFTHGRPHPMIDFRLRNERILQEARDPETAVILLDVVLGYGAHPDPAGELVPAIKEARRIAHSAKRNLVFVGSVCGTDEDPQGLSRQEARLREVGVILTDSNAQAARLSAAIVTKR